MKIIDCIEINTTPEKVFYWLEVSDHGMLWMTSVTKSEIIHETPNKVGTTFREYIEEGGYGGEMQGVITEYVSNERFAVRLESEIISIDVLFDLEDKGDKTQLMQHVDFQFKDIEMKVLSVFFRTSIRKMIINQARKESARLKELSELTRSLRRRINPRLSSAVNIPP